MKRKFLIIITVLIGVAATIAFAGVRVPKFGQCGGIGYNGPNVCEPGSTCKKINDHYYQCQ